MKVIVDLLSIIPGRNRGTQTYVDSLLPELYVLPDIDIVCLTNKLNHDYYRTKLQFQCQLTPINGANRLFRTLYQQIAMSSAAKLAGGDVLFCPAYLSPVFRALPTVVVLHDMNFRDIPESVPMGVRLTYNIVVPRAVRSASRIITVSQFSKERIIDQLGDIGGKVVVVHEGPLASLCKNAEVDWSLLAKKYSIRGEYFLSISSGAPHKNLKRLVQGFVEMKKQSLGEQQLVLIGHELDGDIRAYLEDQGYPDDLVATGFVSEEEKVSFLKNSIAYFFPSLYEGFGLPALEAHSCGLPLAASRYASLPEVCGRGAIYFDAMSVESIQNTFLDLCKNTDLRRHLVQAGYDNLSRFSWQRAATETLEVLRSAVERAELNTGV